MIIIKGPATRAKALLEKIERERTLVNLYKALHTNPDMTEKPVVVSTPIAKDILFDEYV